MAFLHAVWENSSIHLFCNLLVSWHWRWKERAACLCHSRFCRPPSYPSSAASFFKSKGLDFIHPLFENFDCPFAFHEPFLVLLDACWDEDLNFVLSKEFPVLILFFKLLGVISWKHQLSLASMSCLLSQLELAGFPLYALIYICLNRSSSFILIQLLL